MTAGTGRPLSGQLAYQESILDGVSRTFALTIPALPERLRAVVGNAYLLCRIADTIEDEPALSFKRKREYSERFIELVAGDAGAGEFAKDLSCSLSADVSEHERDLIVNTATVLELTHSFNQRQRRALHRCVKIMSQGMTEYQRNVTTEGLRDMADMDRYCYFVAGVVGEMLTELFCDYSPQINERQEELSRLAVSFGQGLQMTNILKDIWVDLNRGVCWLPRTVFVRAGFDLRDLSPERHDPGFASGLNDLIAATACHLGDALQYTLIIPRRERKIRQHLLWALGFAVLSLRKLHGNPTFRSGREVKISRRAVWSVVYVTSALASSNGALKFMFDRSASGLPKISEGTRIELSADVDAPACAGR